jgi:RNA polymerase sigma factor (sigma-70 family)
MAVASVHAIAVPMDSEIPLDAARSDGLRAHFDACAPSLLRLISARMGSRTDAEDLIQELWIKLETLQTGPVVNPKAYLHRMALNMANDLVRARVRRRGREEAWSDLMVAEHNSVAIDPTPSPERTLFAKRELEQLSQAIRSLPDRAQQAFRHHRIEGLNHAETADAMGISKSAVEKHMANAMKYLLRAMSGGDQA